MLESLGVKPISELNDREVDVLRRLRWRCRTDLGFLCREVLGFTKVSDKNGGPFRAFHQPIIDILQHFPAPVGNEVSDNDQFIRGKWQYKPLRDMLDLEGKRRALILDPRGHYKTTINVMAHSIQWILNYPDVALLIFGASEGKVCDVLSEIKGKFQFNEKFRSLFPEYCPQDNVFDFGKMSEFTTPARSQQNTRREPTMKAAALEKSASGYHFDIIKFSDIVDETNVSGNGLQHVREKFYISENLLVSPIFWIDVEGTRYHFADTYGHIIESELWQTLPDGKKILRPEETKDYKMHVRSVFKRNLRGEEPTFYPTEKELKAPFILDEKGKRQPWIPEMFPLPKLERMESNDPYLFSCQQLNNPSSNVEGASPFPTGGGIPAIIDRKTYESNIRIAYKDIIADFASTANPRSNYTVIAVVATSAGGKKYVEKIVHGKWLPKEAIDRLLLAVVMEQPPRSKGRYLRNVIMEDVEFTKGLMPGIMSIVDREFHQKRLEFPLKLIKRDNQVTKNDRIFKSLSPAWNRKDLVFLNDIEPDIWAHLLKEAEQFPRSQTDDILDALADAYNEVEYFGREIPRQNYQQQVAAYMDRWLDTEPWIPGQAPDSEFSSMTRQNPYYDKTGGL